MSTVLYNGFVAKKFSRRFSSSILLNSKSLSISLLKNDRFSIKKFKYSCFKTSDFSLIIPFCNISNKLDDSEVFLIEKVLNSEAISSEKLFKNNKKK